MPIQQSLQIATMFVAAVFSTSTVRGQPSGEVQRVVALVGGLSQFDLSGTGTTGVLGLRGELRAKRWLVLQAGLTAFRPQEQFGEKVTYAIPEVQVQLQVPSRSVRPYLGLGVGAMLAGGNRDAQRAVSGAGGVRISIPNSRLDVRAELRVRGIGESFTGGMAEWTLGSGYRF